jgi:hypothetical protein
MIVVATSGPDFDGPVKIRPPFQANYDGTVYLPGQTAQVPGLVARYWLDLGIAIAAPRPEAKGEKK